MPDFNLPNLEPADEASARAQKHFLAAAEMYDLLTEVQTGPGGLGDTFVLYEDHGGYFDTGLPAVAAHLHRGENGTFSLSATRMPAFALAAAWLVGRGADASTFTNASDHRGAPADARSAACTQRLLADPSRYQLSEWGTEPHESWALLHDGDPAAADRPFLLLLETGSAERGYVLREGSFATPQDAQQWLEAREVPLPTVVAGQVEVHASPQARAARTRSTTTFAEPNQRRGTGVSPAAQPAPVPSRRAVL
ncbi:hypothetical protein [Streptacidiphilus sp. MAP5-52]|uniref:hypothetical protein n=1 Tax=Streptacidiphilus sp. MAP5-52 TaxID=3156267 RepID=UPI003513F0AC